MAQSQPKVNLQPGSPDVPAQASDAVLLSKLHTLKSIIQTLREESQEEVRNDARRASIATDASSSSSSQPDLSSYTYEEFCNDLDMDDMYTRRILELLVRETASRREDSTTSMFRPRYMSR